MKTLSTLTAICLCLASLAHADLRGTIDEIVRQDPLGGATVGIYVIDAATSEAVVNINGEKALKPASCNKLFTTAAGLSLLGPEYRFITTVTTTGTISDGVLRGTLTVTGGGDPSISGRFETDKRDVTAIMRRWAEQLKAKGIQRITGGLLADDRFFDRDYFHEAWYPNERAEWYEAEIWGLSFNDNCVDLSWSGANKLPGDPASFQMNPQTAYAAIDNRVRVIAKGRSSERYYRRGATSNDITASGTITVDTSREDSAAIHNGPLYFLSVFRDVLTSSGITVEGYNSLIAEGAAPDSVSTEPLIRHESQPLREIVNVVNRNSQNFYAECVFKTLGRTRGAGGSFPASADVTMQFCRDAGIFTSGHAMVDGSGLSARNRTSPRQLAELLRYMDKGPLAITWRTSLPVGGTRGSLRTRFQETSSSRQLAPRIMGKTGLIGGVRSLSGIARNQDDREFYYSIMVNDFSAGSDDVLEFIDKVALAIAADESR